MPRDPRLKFTLADLMILISATGFGLGCYVLVDNSLFAGHRYMFGLFEAPKGGWNSALLVDRIAGALASMLILFGGWTFAIPLMGMRRPRPIRRRLVRAPGMTACVAAMTGMAIAAGVAGLSIGLRWAVDGSITPPRNFWIKGNLFDNVIIFAGIAVSAAWICQFVAGRWLPSPNGIDRLGRSIGGLWVAVGLIFATRQFFS